MQGEKRMNQRVLIEKNYLRIPIRKDAVEKNVWLYQELTAVLQFQAGLFVDYGSGAPDFYAELPVERWKGSVLTLVHEEDRPVPFLQSKYRAISAMDSFCTEKRMDE